MLGVAEVMEEVAALAVSVEQGCVLYSPPASLEKWDRQLISDCRFLVRDGELLLCSPAVAAAAAGVTSPYAHHHLKLPRAGFTVDVLLSLHILAAQVSEVGAAQCVGVCVLGRGRRWGAAF